MEPIDIYNSIHDYGMANQNPALVAKYSRYFKEGYDAYGLSHEQVRVKLDEILSKPGTTLELIMAASLLLVKSPKYEMTVMGFQLVLSYHKSWTSDTFKTVEQWFSIGITNWAQTDYICGELMNMFFSKKIIGMEDIRPWRTADNKFQRRAAVVSLIKPMKLSVDFTPYYEFIGPMMHDPAREVHQGLGWFLRESWKKQPGPAEAFLMKYKDSAPRLIFSMPLRR